jgi:UDP-N-acetylglucosamine acyltransferase
MAAIDPTARIAPGAVVGSEVEIGPYCVIGPDVAIGDNCRLVAHVHVAGHTTIGAGTVIQPFASLGTPPQSVRYRGGPTRLTIGAGCDIREAVTMNIGTEDDRGVTSVGNNCFFMVGSHVGHDCAVGNNVTFANNAVLGGHVLVEDHVFLGGNSAVHQFVRIGESAMISGMCGIRGDVIPFGYCIGAIGRLAGLNVIGMRRRKLTRADLHDVRRAYNALFKTSGQFTERIESVAKEFAGVALVTQIVDFLRAAGKRPILMARTRGRLEEDPLEGDPGEP